jgi:uncharacterized protein YndB with AHSA1/START domain
MPGARQYEFLTTWLIEAERERLFEAIWESPRWPQWWPGVVEAVEVEAGDKRGVGRRGR